MSTEPHRLRVALLAPALDERAGGISAMVGELGAGLQRDGRAGIKAFAPEDAARAKRFWGRSTDRLVRAVLEFGPDIVHTNGLWAVQSGAGAALARVHRRREIVSPHGMLDAWALNNRRWKKRIAWHWFERAHLARAQAIHALGQAEAESIRALGLRPPIAIIPNGVNLPKTPAAGAPPWQDAWGETARVLLFLGRIHPKKGLDPLIRAWARLPRDIVAEGWRLAIAGWDDGGQAERCRNAIREGGIENSCALFGPLFGERKETALAGARAFILPSYSEGLPVAVLEAWAHGLPVLMTRACNLPEGFAAGAAAEIATGPERLAEQIAAFVAKPDPERRAMGMAGRELVKRQFAWPTIGAQYVELYEWVGGRGPRPAFVVT